ncbi:TetR/AcrR family transcriptional regulator [Pedobacter gandavensis]|uniref:TetR family transcriptional regulator n=1 Tax=Pedobacter gandavensis TaxID=2679963 RepID=A0ABR6F2P9_9SPHI|nr:TetR/AcrR family transcriptional regulator [Pedobacter gandavensis]MBB2151815.1 TetR family transcriptional regulator [Pedobacter gandavensis]
MVKKEPTEAIKSRLLTERKLIDAVGAIIKAKGYRALGVNEIAREAKVTKKLIYRYFENVDRLIETYVIEKDYWLSYKKNISNDIEGINKKSALVDTISSLLEKQFEYFWNEEEMQKIILWEISERTVLLDSMCKVRAEQGDILLEMSDPYFKNSPVSLRGVSALLVSGIYYMVLHAKKNDSTICGLDINSAEGRAEVQKSIRHIVEWAFQAGKAKNKII